MHTRVKHDDVGTLTYRFAWFMRGAEYMLTNGIVESVFGLGSCLHQNRKSQNGYIMNFQNPGLVDQEQRLLVQHLHRT